jgi:hypothetical protein
VSIGVFRTQANEVFPLDPTALIPICPPPVPYPHFILISPQQNETLTLTWFFLLVGCKKPTRVPELHSRIFAPIHPPNVLETWPDLVKIGSIDPTTVPEQILETTEEEKRIARARALLPHPAAALNLDDIETLAQTVLTATAWAYYSSAGDDEISEFFFSDCLTPSLFSAQRLDLLSLSASLPWIIPFSVRHHSSPILSQFFPISLVSWLPLNDTINVSLLDTDINDFTGMAP